MGWAVLWGVVWWLLLNGFWLVLVDTLQGPEILVGVGASTIAVGAAVAIRAEGGLSFPMRWRWLPLLGPLPWGAVRDTGLVFWALARKVLLRQPVHGVFRAVHFPAGGDDPESVAWRAVATWGTSFTPDTYVVGIDRERQEIIIHQLVPSPPEKVKQRVVGTE